MTLALAKLPTTPEIRSLIAKLLLPLRTHPAFVWAWSRSNAAGFEEASRLPFEDE